MQQSLYALLRYAENRFAREEEVMAACGYPELRGHRLEHRDVVDRINALHRRFDEDSEGAAAQVVEGRRGLAAPMSRLCAIRKFIFISID